MVLVEWLVFDSCNAYNENLESNSPSGWLKA